MMFQLLLMSVFYLLVQNASFAATPEPPARPANYVNDFAGIIDDPQEVQMNAYLKELEQKTTVQIMVLTVQSLDGEDIAGFGLKMAEKWKPGQKGKDNGAIIIVALKDKKYRIEVGYGLEGVLPDGFVGSVGREHMVPHFRKGDYTGGLFSAVTAMTQAIAAKENIEITGMPKPKARGQVQRQPAQKKDSTFTIILAGILFVLALALFIKNPSLFSYIFINIIYNTLLALIFSRNSGGWSGGGGGFGGGGGGGFGGGGASGDW